MIDRKGVAFDRIYTGIFNGPLYGQPFPMPSQPAGLVLRTENKEAKGLPACPCRLAASRCSRRRVARRCWSARAA